MKKIIKKIVSAFMCLGLICTILSKITATTPIDNSIYLSSDIPERDIIIEKQFPVFYSISNTSPNLFS